MSMSTQQTRELLDRANAGDGDAVLSLLAAAETECDPGSDVIREIAARGGQAHRVAFLGVRGSGKSTLIVELARYVRANGARVGVVSSDRAPETGTAARLGDRLRLDDLEFDEGIVVRSIPALDGPRAHAIKTCFAADTFDAAGFDPIFLEIFGIRGPDLRQLRRGHSVVLVLTPQSPDPELLSESGLLAMCDIVVLNKADQEGAAELEAGLREFLPLQRLSGGEWEIPILPTTAYRSEGIAEVADALREHVELLRGGGEFDARRRSQLALQLEQLVEDALLARLYGGGSVADLVRDAAQSVARHEVDLAEAANRIAHRLLEGD